MSPLLSRQLTFWGAALALTVITLVAAGYYIYEPPFPAAALVKPMAAHTVVIKSWAEVEAADAANPGLTDYEEAMHLKESENYGEDSEEGRLVNIKFFEKFKQAAAKGHVMAMLYAGKCAQLGRGCEPDEELALKYFYQSAIHGYDRAALEVARCYAMGMGVAPSAQLARQWYERSIQLRRSDSLLDYGRYLWRNGKTDAEVKYGLNLLREASTAGEAAASFILAGALIKTVELTPAVRRDICNRVRVGAQSGDWNCANLMMEMYQSGLAFPEGEDERKAYFWSLISLHLADNRGSSKYSQKMVADNGAKLSNDIRTFEQMFAQDWIEQNTEDEEE